MCEGKQQTGVFRAKRKQSENEVTVSERIPGEDPKHPAERPPGDHEGKVASTGNEERESIETLGEKKNKNQKQRRRQAKKKKRACVKKGKEK